MTYFVISAEDLSVLAQLGVAIPVDESDASMVAKSIDDQTRLSQHDLLLRNVAFCECKLEVLAHLLEQLALHVCYVAT